MIDFHVFVVLLIVLGLVLLDWLVGIIVALVRGAFDPGTLPRQLETFVLPYVGSLLVLAILQAFSHFVTVAGVSGAASGTFYGAASAVGIKAVADIVSKATGLIGNAPAPPAAA